MIKPPPRPPSGAKPVTIPAISAEVKPPAPPAEFADAAAANTATLANLGLALSSPNGYLLPLLLVGALLAVSMVGSINIARDDKERE